jgi:hypothetical protein
MESLVRNCRRVYLTYFSQPVSDRVIYRLIRKHRSRTILELGMGTGRRTLRMFDAAGQAAASGSLSYNGIDLFEMRSAGDGPGLSLKLAHRQLRATGAKVRLVPGQIYEALARSANDIGPCDLIVISAGHDRYSLAKAWFYFPRMLHATSQVCLEERDESTGATTLRLVPHAEICSLAAATTRRSAA